MRTAAEPVLDLATASGGESSRLLPTGRSPGTLGLAGRTTRSPPSMQSMSPPSFSFSEAEPIVVSWDRRLRRTSAAEGPRLPRHDDGSLEVVGRRVCQQRGDAFEPDLVGDEALERVGTATEECERRA